MDNIGKCECWIGVRYDYEDTDLVTLVDLKQETAGFDKWFDLKCEV